MRSTFKLPDDYKNENPNILNYIRKHINDENQHYLFFGKVGCGKTYLAKLLSDRDTEFVECRSIYEDFLRVQVGNKSDKPERLRKLNRALRGKDVILDDLGDERDTTSAHYFIGSIIEDRYNMIKKGLAKRTVITTNLTPRQLADTYGHRVIDRLQDVFVFMEFKNKSFRNRNVVSING